MANNENFILKKRRTFWQFRMSKADLTRPFLCSLILRFQISSSSLKRFVWLSKIISFQTKAAAEDVNCRRRFCDSKFNIGLQLDRWSFIEDKDFEGKSGQRLVTRLIINSGEVVQAMRKLLAAFTGQSRDALSLNGQPLSITFKSLFCPVLFGEKASTLSLPRLAGFAA